MEPFQRSLAALTVILICGILTGLWARRRWALSYGFIGYLVVVAAGEGLIACWPFHFYRLGFWELKETAYAAVKMALAMELGGLAFAAFPGAHHRAQQLAALVLLALLAAMLFGGMSLDLQAHLANGTALLLASVWGLVFWYRVPLHHLHRAILRGLAAYLLIFTLALRLVVLLGPPARQLVAWVDGTAYVLLLACWLWEAWRPEPAPAGPPELLARLQPWRARL